MKYANIAKLQICAIDEGLCPDYFHWKVVHFRHVTIKKIYLK